jgi:flagellar hook protein FlgE
MFDTIFIGTSGLLTHAKGLRVVGNNLANVNTPGFKGAQLQFGELFEQGSGAPAPAAGGNARGLGGGVVSLGSRIDFRAGLDQSSGNPLDLAISGNGLYAIRRDGQVLYTRAGDFRFDQQGVLVNSAGDKVLGLEEGGQLAEVSLEKLGRSMPKVTTTVKLRGNLSSTVATPAADFRINGVTVFDAGGVERPLNLKFHNNGGGDYTLSMTDAAGTELSAQHLKFVGGFPDPAQEPIVVEIPVAGASPCTVKLDFSENVTALAEASTLAMASQDGYAAGVRTDSSIGSDGTLTVHYSNGQEAKGPRLALADFDSDSALEQVGGSAFASKHDARVQYGYAGSAGFGKLVSGHREGSNVDLAEEFGNLILMQRGYQASSHVISTANDMIQQLFDMKSR